MKLVQQLKLSCSISLVLLSFMPVQAEAVESETLISRSTLYSSKQLDDPLSFNAPPPPDDIDAPGDRVGGGKRGCENLAKQLTGSKGKLLTALVPVYGAPDSGLVLGATTASHPTFWFYVPDAPAVEAEFVLQDQASQTIYQSPVLLSKMPGVVSLSLPSHATPLEIGKLYHWYFNIYCQPQQPPVFVDGWIKRDSLNSDLNNQLEKATPKQRISLLAAHGIWYDALTAAAELSTDSKHTDWVTLLQIVGLDNISTEPVVDCCHFKSQ